MSKGNERIIARIPADLLASMREEIRMQNLNSKAPPWTESEFIRVAVRELVRKRRASRRPKRGADGQ